MKILVTGGAGYIGSVVVEELLTHGHQVTVYDSLVKGHRDAVPSDATLIQGDILDGPTLRQALAGNQAVIHLAAHSLVGESVQNPALYYQNNVVGTLCLLDCMRAEGVKLLVFSSTAAVYGEPEEQPIPEDARVSPTNPYGETKLAGERAIAWYAEAYGLRYACLRYFNAAGATERCPERHDPESHLIPLVLQVAAGKRSHIAIFGTDYPTPDGTCIRDYIHVRDLASAHLACLFALSTGQIQRATYNLGCGGKGASVREVIQLAAEVTEREIPITYAERRPGDPAILLAQGNRIHKELGFVPRHNDLRQILQSAWRHF